MAQAVKLRPEEVQQELATPLRGELIQPGDPGYEDARSLYNGMIDRRPALIARCRDVADVMSGVNFGREHGLDIAVRGGGHNGPGLGSVDDGLVIDLSPMRGVRVDVEARTAQVAGGSLLGDLDHAAHAFGLATPAGIISTTGVGGLTLGGGLGHLTRKHGLTIDNLLSADVVLADGSFVTASAEREEELFWALRGGGGNFGVVTSFTYALHPVHTVVAGPMFWELEDTPEVMRAYREFLPQAPEELNGFFAFLTVPPAPPFPEHLHGRKVCGVVWCYTGAPEDLDGLLAPMRAVGSVLLYGIVPMPYPVIQSAFDALYPAGDQWYWRADHVKELPDESIERHLEFARALPTPQSTMHLYPIDGAVHRVGPSETAWSYRDATWAEVIVGVDPDPARAGELRDWTVAYWEAVHPYSMGGAYVNMMMEEGDDRVRAAYGGNYDRLARVKAAYDPANLFHVNQNIRPAP